MPLCSLEEALEDLKAGKMLIVVDDESRENEGDLVMAAEKVTPEAINFIVKYGQGPPLHADHWRCGWTNSRCR